MSNHKPHKRPDPDEHEVLLFAIALCLADNRSNKQIAARLNLGIDKVKRLRREVQERHLLVADRSKASSPDIFEEAWRLVHPTNVIELLKAVAHKAGVLPVKTYVSVGASNGSGHSSWRARLRRFAKLARAHLLRALSGAERVGVTYGETLLETFKGADLNSMGTKMTFFPVCCDPFKFQREPWASSNLAKYLTQAQGRKAEALSLTGALPVIPMNYNTQTKEFLMKELEQAPDYNRIFGNNKDALIRTMNTLITSIGRIEMPWCLGDDYFVSTLCIDRAILNRLLAAEIGGVPIAKTTLTAMERELMETINGSRIGMMLEDIERTARKAACGPAPGVIVVAIGASKAKYLLELIKRGLVNTAIVDHDLEEELLRLLAPEAGR